jgi:hypothetical protein
MAAIAFVLHGGVTAAMRTKYLCLDGFARGPFDKAKAFVRRVNLIPSSRSAMVVAPDAVIRADGSCAWDALADRLEMARIEKKGLGGVNHDRLLSRLTGGRGVGRPPARFDGP